MRQPIVDALLLVAVLGAWVGVIGFARLRTPLDRLHCAAFVNVICGAAIVLAAFASDGLADRPLKFLFVVVANLIAGAAMSHAIGRTLVGRGQQP